MARKKVAFEQLVFQEAEVILVSIVLTHLLPQLSQKVLLSPKRYSSAMCISMASPTVGATDNVKIE